MPEILIEYKTQILEVLSFITLPFLVMLISLAFVYAFGRMLNITKKAVSKNLVALIVICSSYFFYFYAMVKNMDLFTKIWTGLLYGALSIIFYVTLGFKFFDRIDNFLDKVAPDSKVVSTPKEIPDKKVLKKK